MRKGYCYKCKTAPSSAAWGRLMFVLYGAFN